MPDLTKIVKGVQDVSVSEIAIKDADGNVQTFASTPIGQLPVHDLVAVATLTEMSQKLDRIIELLEEITE